MNRTDKLEMGKFLLVVVCAEVRIVVRMSLSLRLKLPAS